MEWWNSGLNWGAALAIGIPILVSAIALVISLRSLRWERASADAATRSAEAAERANRLTERLLERDNLITAPSDESPDVSWSITNPSGGLFVMRNTGTAIADDVTIDPDSISAVTKSLPSDAVVRPNEAVEFFIFGRWGAPVPNQVYVTWKGQEEPAAVPLPR